MSSRSFPNSLRFRDRNIQLTYYHGIRASDKLEFWNANHNVMHKKKKKLRKKEKATIIATQNEQFKRKNKKKELSLHHSIEQSVHTAWPIITTPSRINYSEFINGKPSKISKDKKGFAWPQIKSKLWLNTQNFRTENLTFSRNPPSTYQNPIVGNKSTKLNLTTKRTSK